jgi:signal transduction histidine kinase/DNA-binding response OmpR family regulator/HPt (histidine-containing phosphotransfer) domain-containing protein
MEKLPAHNDALMLRLLAIAGAGGAALAAGISFFRPQAQWSIVGVVLALLGVAGVAGLWHAMRKRARHLAEVTQESGEQKREMSALQQELAIHRQLERELMEAKQTAESAMLAKGEFLATMSHEIRTPLNGIIPMLDLLMSARLAPDQHDIVRTAYTSARQMLRIVDDILDYSKLEANKLQLESTGFNLRELLDSIIHLMEKPAEAKGLRLQLHIDPSVRLAVRGDPVRLRQILSNLVSNALKFTERGSVSVHVSRRGETRSQHDLRFEVRDTGIGISAAGITRLFQPFTQADNSTTRLYGGTGLGLVICKRIVDLMGGNIGVTSEPGRGSTFWFDIPLLKAVGDIQGQRTDLNGSKVLLLSNDAPLRQRLKQAMPGWGAQLAECETTQDALNRLRAALSRGNSWSFDLLLVDLNSVRTTAIALHRNLRRTIELEDLRVVYLQGNDPPPGELSEGHPALFLSRSMGHMEMRTAISSYLATPPNMQPEPVKLADNDISAFGEIGMLEPEPPPAASAPAATPATPAPNKLRGHLLLVEDNPVNQMVAQRLIAMLGLSCETADNGEKALERMRLGGIDLVLMDCQMPVKDGYAATRDWRELEKQQGAPRLPIVAMTANAMAGDRQKCLDAGMDDYLSKPVDRRLLEACVSKWLLKSPRAQGGANELVGAPAAIVALRPAAAVAPPPAAPVAAVAPATFPPQPAPAPARPAAAVAETPPAEAPSAPPVLAMDVVEELRMVMGAEYLNLIKLFLHDAPAHIKRLEAAAANNDIAGMVAPAHTLKSSSANLGALGLSAAAKRIEIGARGDALPRPAAAVAVLENEFKRAKAALETLLQG